MFEIELAFFDAIRILKHIPNEENNCIIFIRKRSQNNQEQNFISDSFLFSKNAIFGKKHFSEIIS